MLLIIFCNLSKIIFKIKKAKSSILLKSIYVNRLILPVCVVVFFVVFAFAVFVLILSANRVKQKQKLSDRNRRWCGLDA